MSLENFDAIESGPLQKLQMVFRDNDIEVEIEAHDNQFSIHHPELESLTGSIEADEIVLDYIENDGFTVTAATETIKALQDFGTEFGYSLRAANVLPNARSFWLKVGFAEQGSDFVWESDAQLKVA